MLNIFYSLTTLKQYVIAVGTASTPACKCGVKRSSRIVGGIETEVIIASNQII